MNKGEPVRFDGSLRMAMPPPGAVCPAIVRLPAFGLIWLSRLIVPETRKTHVLAPDAIMHSRKDPAPESASVVTAMARPPRPPFAAAPKPSAVGKARCWPSGSFAGLKLPGVRGEDVGVEVGVGAGDGAGAGVGPTGGVVTGGEDDVAPPSPHPANSRHVASVHVKALPFPCGER